MKNFTFYRFVNMLALIVMLFSVTSYAQDIHFTFANAQNTNDGTNDYYEVDVMIQTINATGSFKLSSGQLYFTYNTLAFGENVKANARFETSQPNAGGYICGQYVDAAAADIYGVFTVNDNTTSRVSWAFSQVFSSSTFAADNVIDTPKKLVHLKFQYIDFGQVPMVEFEDGEVYDDQFYTACGPAGGPFTPADCGASPGNQLFNDTFDSGGATLSNIGVETVTTVSIFPNPTSHYINISSNYDLNKIEIFDLLGKKVLSTDATKQIRIKHLPSGLYLVKVFSSKGILTKKIVIE